MESFEQKIKERNNLLKSQVDALTGRNELVEVVETLLKAGVAEEDLVEKAKYIRRESDGKGGYKYIYNEEPKEHSGSTQSGYGEYLPKSKDVKKELEEFDNKLSDKDKKDISDAINKFKQSGGVFGSAEDVLKFKQKFIKEKKTDKVDKKEGDVDILDKLEDEKLSLLKEVDILVKKHKKLYSNMDIESPKSEEEKKSEKEIADIFSKINNIVHQKNKIKKERKVQKSSESDLEKAKADKKQQKKIKKVMDEWKAGTLLDPHGNKITDRKQVLAVALSEAGLSKKE